MKKRTLLLALALLLALLLALAGCGQKGGTGGPLRFDLERAPTTLDPQFATSDSSLLVVANVFEGLTRLSPSGEVEPACAERWETSPDGRVYTFFLREGLAWSDGSALTADDFVFAFERLLSVDAPSPSASLFLSLEGAAARTEGHAAPLGVSAPDARTVRFALVQPDPTFPARLAQSGAMPCSERFFTEQKGRYGLTGDSILCNGPFTVTSWSAEQLSLRPNDKHHTGAANDGVNLYIGRGDPAALFFEGRSDFCVIPYHRLAETGPLKGDTFFDQTWTLLIDLDGPMGRDWGLRAALLSSLGDDLAANRLPEWLTSAQGLIPASAILDGGSYRARAGSTTPAAPVADPRALFLSSLERLGLDKPPASTLLVADFAPNPELGGAMQRVWQQKLSAHVNMEQLPYDELTARVARGDYDLALLPLPSQGNRPDDYLAAFSNLALARLSPAPPAAEAGQTSAAPSAASKAPADAPPAAEPGLSASAPRLGDLLEEARGRAEPDQSASAFLAVEQRLIDGWAVLPLYDAPSFFAQGEAVEGAVYAAASRAVYFADAVRIP